MSRETRPIPGLFGGISQQIPAMRHPTQGEEQHNMLATVVDGLFLRPGTQATLFPMPNTGANEATVEGTNGNAFGHFFKTPDGALYVLALVNGNLMLYDAVSGDAQDVTFPDGRAYLNNAAPASGFSCLTLADYTFIVNNAVVPQTTTAVAPANPVNVAYVDVRTAVASKVYSISIGSTTATFTSSASPSQLEIAAGLRTALAAAFPSGYTFSVIGTTNVIKMVRTDGAPLTGVEAWDSWDTKTMLVVSDGAPTYADLPYRFEEGFTVTVNGTADSSDDPYYVRWDGSKWVETVKPGTRTTLDAATLPHQLVKTGATTWTFQRVANWGSRRVGDEETAPDPSFVGQPIRDVFFYRNRLGFLSGDSVALSRAGDYFEFYPRTATQVLDNDPIDLASPVGGVNYLSYATPFNQGLVVWSDASQQFSLVAGDILSPRNARLVPTTTFAMDPSVRPVALGNRAVFAEDVGVQTHLSAYRVAPDAATNFAVRLTEHVPRLLGQGQLTLAASTAAKYVAVLTPSDIRLFGYELDEAGEAYTQRCWSTHTLNAGGNSRGYTAKPVAAFWDASRLHLLLYRTSGLAEDPGGRYFVEVLDTSVGQTDGDLPYSLCLDRRLILAAPGSYDPVTDETAIQLPYTDQFLKAYECEPTRYPRPVPIRSRVTTGLVCTVRLPGDLTGSTVVFGVPYQGRYTFTEVLFRDSNGIPMQSARVRLIRYKVRLNKSANLEAVVVPRLRRGYVYPLGVGDLGDAEVPLGDPLLATEDGDVPVHADAAGTRVTLLCSGPLPCVVPYAEWVAEVTTNARR